MQNPFHTYRKELRKQWSQFIRANFRNAPEAARAFGVDESTARLWWKGSHAPSGYAMGLAHDQYPEAATEHLSPSRKI